MGDFLLQKRPLANAVAVTFIILVNGLQRLNGPAIDGGLFNNCLFNFPDIRLDITVSGGHQWYISVNLLTAINGNSH
jgi:hypothetical protein